MYRKWYLSTWLICLLFAFWPIIIPPIIGIVLLVLQYQEHTVLQNSYGEIDSLELSKARIATEIIKLENEKQECTASLEQLKKDTEEKIQKLTIDTNVAIGQLKSKKQTQIDELENTIRKLDNEIAHLGQNTILNSYNYSDYNGLTSEECKNRLSILKNREQDLVKNGVWVKVTSDADKKTVNNNIKQIVRCFNSECDNILVNLTAKNIDNQRKKIERSFSSLNNIFSVDGMSLDEQALEMKLEQLNLVYTYELKREQEKEQQRAIREQMVEEEKVRKEIEREKAKLDKEGTQFKNEISRLMEYLNTSKNVIQSQLYADKIRELEEKLLQLERDRENVLQREQNTRAGFVYIVSNIGSFGEDVFKIGMTRRLEPMERVRELGGASVPFRFDVHALIFSDDAPSLETTLHQSFKEYEINKVNPRKEFFRIPLNTIKEAVLQNHNRTVEFVIEPEAEEYRQSLLVHS